MDELELRKLILERMQESSNKLNEATQTFWNALLTINGLFLSFFAFFTDKTNISKSLIIIYGIVTALPVMIVLYFTWLQKILNVKLFNLSALSSEELINTITNNKDYTPHETEKRKLKKRVIFFSKLNNFLENVAIVCTATAIILIFYIGFKF